MASNPVHRIPFVPVTSIPVSLNPNSAVLIRSLKNLEIWMQLSTDEEDGIQSKATLLKWIPEANSGAGAWYPYRHPVSFDTTENDGKLMAAWDNDLDNAAYFQVLIPTTVTVMEAFMQGVRY